MFPSLIQRVAASDRLAKLKAISRHIYWAIGQYKFTIPAYYFPIPISVDSTYLAYSQHSWGHRQLWGNDSWKILFDSYLKDRVI